MGNNTAATITNCYASGTVIDNGHNVGGLVGSNGYGYVYTSYAAVNISGTAYNVGGLVGINNLTVNSSFSTGNATGVSNSPFVGPLFGQSDGVVTNSYYAGSATNTGAGGVNTSGTSATVASLKQTDAAVYSGWTFDPTHWQINAGLSYPYLVLSSFIPNPSSIVESSIGNAITITGTNTSWTAGTPGTPTFTLASGTGASIASQTVTDATHATLTITAGSSPGSLIITDPLGGATATVNVVASSDATLSALAISQGALTPTFIAGTTSYTARVANSVSSVIVTPTAHQANATITVNGTAVTSGSASSPIALSVGSNTITVVVTAQNGSTTGTYAITITRAANSATALASSQNPSTFGQSVTFTATVTPASAGGTVTFKDGATTIGTATIGHGSGSIAVSNLSVGSHSLTAVYGGDSNYAGSTSDTVTQTVNQALSTTVVASSRIPPPSASPSPSPPPSRPQAPPAP